jgi:tetratricopeptide (TPR) repeat protein
MPGARAHEAGALRGPAERPAAEVDEPPAGAESSAPSRAVDPPQGARPSLDALRAAMGRLLAGGAGSRAENRAPLNASEGSRVGRRSSPGEEQAGAGLGRGELAFETLVTPEGPLHRSRSVAPPGARVGRVELEPALRAEASLLSLLALDPTLAERDPRGALYLDVESTGLGTSAGVVPFLIGLAFVEGGAVVVEQLLLKSLAEEAPALLALRERVLRASLLVTFNGKSFDWPLLETRFVMNRLEAPRPPAHLDLLHVARRVHGARLGSTTLARVESHVLGEERVDDVGGREILSVYSHFLRTGDEGALAPVVEHNARDVRSMVALVSLYGEPLASRSTLPGDDLAGMARTLARAGALEQALALADQAVSSDDGPRARRVRGDLALARGDRARALTDFEALLAMADDDAVRLRLAKLYEHHVREYERALAIVARGTGEGPEAIGKRRRRLERKRDKNERAAPRASEPLFDAGAPSVGGPRPRSLG